MAKHQRAAVTAVMNMSLFVLLLLSGWCHNLNDTGLWREYQYINISMTWTQAQSYCRHRFTDLATVDTTDDVNRMVDLVNETDGYRGLVWIGLQTSIQSNWVWSNGEDNISYIPWYPGQPDAGERCAAFLNYYWYSFDCGATFRFACYNESTRYIRIYIEKNWTDAQSYCRRYYTDLATIHNSQEQQQIRAVVGDGFYWMGLYIEFWQWSDQWNLTFRNWEAGQPFIRSGDCVAMSTINSGKWVRYSCYQKYPFVCYGEDRLFSRQIVKLNFSNVGNQNLNDPSLQTAILYKINEKLKSAGLKFSHISWKTDQGGEVFHLNSKRAVNSSTTCDANVPLEN
nr:macrophage mannose receptor 1-like [Misgurnus anguillicaudatus]